MKIRKGDKFRLVDGFVGFRGKKFTCTGTGVERIHGREGIPLIKFTAPDWKGKPCRYVVPRSWCAYEPPNPAKHKAARKGS